MLCLCRRSDYEVGEELLRKYVFIHLSEPADKLQLMLAMLHKLYALVSEAGMLYCANSVSGSAGLRSSLRLEVLGKLTVSVLSGNIYEWCDVCGGWGGDSLMSYEDLLHIYEI